MATGLRGQGGTFRFASGFQFAIPLGGPNYILTGPGSVTLDPSFRWVLAASGPDATYAGLLPDGAPVANPAPCLAASDLPCEDRAAPGVPVVIPAGTTIEVGVGGFIAPLATQPSNRATERL